MKKNLILKQYKTLFKDSRTLYRKVNPTYEDRVQKRQQRMLTRKTYYTLSRETRAAVSAILFIPAQRLHAAI